MFWRFMAHVLGFCLSVFILKGFFLKVWRHTRRSFYLFCIFLTRHTLIQYSSLGRSSPAGHLPELGINSCVWVNNSSCWAEGGVPGGNRTRGCRTAAQRTNHWAALHPDRAALHPVSCAAPCFHTSLGINSVLLLAEISWSGDFEL